VGITVSAPFGEEGNERVGVATVPGLDVASYDFDGIHGVVSGDVNGRLAQALTREAEVKRTFTRNVIGGTPGPEGRYVCCPRRGSDDE
jgi:hypothetical protein